MWQATPDVCVQVTHCYKYFFLSHWPWLGLWSDCKVLSMSKLWACVSRLPPPLFRTEHAQNVKVYRVLSAHSYTDAVHISVDAFTIEVWWNFDKMCKAITGSSGHAFWWETTVLHSMETLFDASLVALESITPGKGILTWLLCMVLVNWSVLWPTCPPVSMSWPETGIPVGRA